MNYKKVSEAPTFYYFTNLVDGITDDATYYAELSKIMEREARNRYEAKDREGNICLVQNPALLTYQACISGPYATLTRYKPVIIAKAQPSSGRATKQATIF